MKNIDWSFLIENDPEVWLEANRHVYFIEWLAEIAPRLEVGTVSKFYPENKEVILITSEGSRLGYPLRDVFRTFDEGIASLNARMQTYSQPLKVKTKKWHQYCLQDLINWFKK